MSLSILVQTFLARWLVALNVSLLAVGLGLGFGGSRSGFFLAALVPIALVPFSFARWRTHRVLADGLTSPIVAGVAVAGILGDLVLAAQLLTARSGLLSPLHGPGVAWIGPVWFSANTLWLLGFLLLAPAGIGARALRRLRNPTRADTASGPPNPDRRVFLQQASVVGAAVPLVAAASGVPLSYDFRVEQRALVLPRWPRELDGLRVVHLSDIHVGAGMGRERLARVAELVNAAHPDVVLHTGDFLTHGRGDFDAPLYEALARVQAPLGQWACLGNHDYDDPERFVRRLADAGVTALRDRAVRLTVDGQPLEIAGLDFVFGPTSRWRAYQRIVPGFGPREAPRILLNHDPTAFQALPGGSADLVLSGHTHGGHVGLQLGRSQAVTVVGLLGLPDQGFFAHGDMRLFVTRCVGFYGYPMRVGIPPEIAVLELRAPGTAEVEEEPLRAL